GFRIVSAASRRDAAKTTRLYHANCQASKIADRPQSSIVPNRQLSSFVAIVFTAAKRRWKRWLSEAPYGARNPLGLVLGRRARFLHASQHMLAELLLKWPLVRQIGDRADGTGPESMSGRTLMLQPKTAGANVARSICPYCGVGCGQLVYHRDGKVIA